jgi:hypothetical protein
METGFRMNHENQTQEIPASHFHGNLTGNALGSCSRQSIPDPAVWPRNATLLLPLRVRNRRETLHQDVRVAAIPKSLVGHFLPQEELDGKWAGYSCYQPRLQEDKSQGRGSSVGLPATGCAANSFSSFDFRLNISSFLQVDSAVSHHTPKHPDGIDLNH